MAGRSKQQGLTLMGFVMVLFVVGFFAFVAIKLFPVYSEYYSVVSDMKGVASEPGIAQADPATVRDKLFRRFYISYVTSVKSEPNVVPMIDIMLVLLIIFMIVTPLIAAGFKATMPKGKNLDPRPEGDNEVILGIDEAGRYFLDGRPLPEGSLEDQLRSIFAARTEDKILYFKADNQLKYGKIQEAVETARRSGVRVMAAITEPTTQQALFSATEEEKEGN